MKSMSLKNQTPNVFKISKFDSQTHLLPHSLCKEIRKKRIKIPKVVAYVIN